MNLRISKLIILTLIILAGGVWGTYFFSTSDTLSRTLKDLTSMIVLSGSLFLAGILIVLILARLKTAPPPKN